jgi:uncharacterized OsmC-like protein
MSGQERVNGLDPRRLAELQLSVASDPAKAEELNRWYARVRWLGAFRSKAYVRTHSLTIDEPADLAGVDTSPNAVEYLLSSLGGCLVTGFVLNATKRGVRIDELEVALEGRIDNILRFLGVGGEGHPGYREIRVKLYVKADAQREVLERIWAETLETSPVANSLTRVVSLTPELSIV